MISGSKTLIQRKVPIFTLLVCMLLVACLLIACSQNNRYREPASDAVSAEQISGMKIMRRMHRMNEDIGEDQLEKFQSLQNSLNIELGQLTKGVTSAPSM